MVDCQDIVQYLANFHLTLADVEPHQLAMFVAARNAAKYVEDLDIPVGRQSQTDRSDAVLEREIDRRRPQSAYQDDSQQTDVPDNEMDLGLIRDAEELPHVFPSQWLLEDVCPTAFYSKLADHELFVPRWGRPDANPGDGDDDARQWEFLDKLATAQSTRQHAYVLLDTSRSMNDRDCRGTVARGLTLAFLLHGLHRNARLHLRPFTAKVHDASSGSAEADFCEIARRVMNLSNIGQTRIQPALEQATGDIRSPGPFLRADILLITDGVSPLSRNPLVAEKLHTLVLGNAEEQDERSGTIATLKSWSRTFRRIWRPQFSELLLPSAADMQAASAALEHAMEQAKQDSASVTSRELRRMMQNVQALQKDLASCTDPQDTLKPEELETLHDRLHQAKQLLKRLPRSKRPKRLHHAPQPSRAQQPIATVLSGRGQSDRSAFWLLLQRIATRLTAWLRNLAKRTPGHQKRTGNGNNPE